MNDNTENKFAEKRKEMVNTQIISRGIKNQSLIEAMIKVPRHMFVPEKYTDYSYMDCPLPIGQGQTISQPYIVALMTELLDLKKNDKVLEIGTGSGYQAAILYELGCNVYTIEILEPIGKNAKKTLDSLGYDSINCKIGNGYEGWEEYAPYNAIILTAAPREIPSALVEQLKLGGRMVMPFEEDHQELKLITKTEEGIEVENIVPVQFVPMTGKTQVEMSRFKRALLDPSRVFDTPNDIINDESLTRNQKIEILRRWEYDARELQVAEEENMQGTNGKLLDEILKAIHELKAEEEFKHFAPTKQGGV